MTALSEERVSIDLDFIGRLKEAASEQELQLRMTEWVDHVGFDRWIYGVGMRSLNLLIGTYPAPFMVRYDATVALQDPMVSAAIEASKPVLWDLHGRRDRMSIQPRTAYQQQLFSMRWDYDIRSGITMPISIGLRKNIGVISFSNTEEIDPRLRARQEPMGLMAASYLQMRLVDLLSTEVMDRTDSPLSRRETECLTWVCSGKTSEEIAKILGISRKTVDGHVENACKALGVRGRTQGVARALHLDLIKP